MKVFGTLLILLTITLVPAEGIHCLTGSQSDSSKTNTIMQKRYCLAFDLRNDTALIRQYRYVHSKAGMWPDIPKGIKAVGTSDMEIYLLGTRMFMILEAPLNWNYDSQMALCGTLEKQAEWNDYVWQFQQVLPYSKNGEKWMHMDNIFQLHPTDSKETAQSGYSEPVYTIPTKRFVAILDLEESPMPVISKNIEIQGILDLQIYRIGSRLCLIVEAVPGFKWDEQMPKSISGQWKVMENVFDLNRDF